MLGRVDVGTGVGGGQDASLAPAYRPHAATACVHNMQQLLNQSMPANCANHPMVKFRQVSAVLGGHGWRCVLRAHI
jgi:hypothetical protein